MSTVPEKAAVVVVHKNHQRENLVQVLGTGSLRQLAIARDDDRVALDIHTDTGLRRPCDDVKLQVR